MREKNLELSNDSDQAKDRSEKVVLGSGCATAVV